MTTIAFDGRTLAADKQTTTGGTPTPTTKVFSAMSPRGERWLYACAGNTAECQEFTRRVKAGQEMRTFTDLGILAIGPRGEVWICSQDLVWCRQMVKQWAIGSGADFALGAMAAGASAVKAVQIASRLNVNTGLGVDALKLVRKSKRKV